jgi:hypothetical protein
MHHDAASLFSRRTAQSLSSCHRLSLGADLLCSLKHSYTLYLHPISRLSVAYVPPTIPYHPGNGRKRRDRVLRGWRDREAFDGMTW